MKQLYQMKQVQQICICVFGVYVCLSNIWCVFWSLFSYGNIKKSYWEDSWFVFNSYKIGYWILIYSNNQNINKSTIQTLYINVKHNIYFFQVYLPPFTFVYLYLLSFTPFTLFTSIYLYLLHLLPFTFIYLHLLHLPSFTLHLPVQWPFTIHLLPFTLFTFIYLHLPPFTSIYFIYSYLPPFTSIYLYLPSIYFHLPSIYLHLPVFKDFGKTKIWKRPSLINISKKWCVSDF